MALALSFNLSLKCFRLAFCIVALTTQALEIYAHFHK